MTVRVTTNNVPRPIIDGFELSADERAEFDYLHWDKIDAGSDSASFFRYHGQLYDLGEFMRGYGMAKDSGLPDHMARWDGYASDSAFSATVVRIVGDDQVIVGRVLS